MQDKNPSAIPPEGETPPVVVTHLSELFPAVSVEKLEWALEQVRIRWSKEGMVVPVR